jgi:NodT family efflux transporter outer membrane factor (OMF) lipoprotein
MRYEGIAIATILVGALVLASCAVGPDYRRPEAIVPTDYKEQGVFKPSHPSDAIQRGEWWAIYHDPILDSLEKQVAISNQTLKSSEAAYRQALALVDEARAGYYPTASVSGGGQRSGHGGNGPGTSGITQYNLTASASWTLDLWGRIRRTVEGDIANAQASAGDLASACLSAQATLASDYFQIRADDELYRVLAATSTAYRRALSITDNQYKAGVASRADVAQAKAQLEGVQSQVIAIGIQRAQLEHAMAVLIGKLPESFALAAVDSPGSALDFVGAPPRHRCQ